MGRAGHGPHLRGRWRVGHLHVLPHRVTESLQRSDDLLHVLPPACLQVHHHLDVAYGNVSERPTVPDF